MAASTTTTQAAAPANHSSNNSNTKRRDDGTDVADVGGSWREKSEGQREEIISAHSNRQNGSYPRRRAISEAKKRTDKGQRSYQSPFVMTADRVMSAKLESSIF